jgi:cytochrome c-type biogenesis protein CcmH
MAVFWLLAALMTAVALAFVLVPLLRPRRAAGPSATQANLEVLRSQRREIEADVAVGALPRDAKGEALQELVGRAEADLAESEVPVAEAPRRPWPAAIAAAIAVPAIAFGMYAAVGNPKATDPALAKAPSGMSEHDVVAMVDKLAQKVRERPDDAQGWSLLARSTAALGRFNESAEAYEHLAKLVPNDPNVLADYADALGMAQGQSLAGRPRDLIDEALKLDPTHHKALALAGTAAMDAGDYPAAVKYWETLAAQLPAGSPDEAQVRQIVAEVRQKAAATGKPVAESPRQVAKAAPAVAKSVTGSVSIAPQIAAKLTGSETLFIFARAEGGSRVPLAIVRASAKELPLKFALDDSQSMSPGASISSAKALRVEARISRSGNAMAQPGDLEGSSAVVQPGARDVNVVVDKVVP